MLLQHIGNACAAIATIVFLFPLQRLLSDFAERHVNNDDWTASVLLIVAPQWLLLMGSLLCVVAVGGFDGLKLGRTTLYALAVAAAVALATASFVFIALYIRPGFTPRVLYVPFIWGVTVATVLLVALSLNPGLVPGGAPSWLRWPWTVFTGLSIVASVPFLGHQVLELGKQGASGLVERIAVVLPSSKESLAKVATLDAQKDFDSLLWRANRLGGRELREAATARLRSDPNFVARLSSQLTTGHVEPALTFLRDATLTPQEQQALAGPARRAMQRWVDRVPAPNYTTPQHLRDLKRWGDEVLAVVPAKFAGSGVAFEPVIEEFRDKVEARP